MFLIVTVKDANLPLPPPIIVTVTIPIREVEVIRQLRKI